MEPSATGSRISNLSLTLISAVLWFVSGVLNRDLLAFSHFSPGIDLLYLPAGIRLIIVLVFGVWGALGILLANLLLTPFQIGPQPILHLVINSLIAGFVPLLCARALQKLLGIGRDLGSLRAIHLPLLALAVSLAAPLAFNIQFLFLGLTRPGDFLRNFSAMALGDFLGCMIALIVARLAVWLVRQRSFSKT